jgi:hypothetical protein
VRRHSLCASRVRGERWRQAAEFSVPYPSCLCCHLPPFLPPICANRLAPVAAVAGVAAVFLLEGERREVIDEGGQRFVLPSLTVYRIVYSAASAVIARSPLRSKATRRATSVRWTAPDPGGLAWDRFSNLKTGPATRSGRATAAESNSRRADVQRELSLRRLLKGAEPGSAVAQPDSITPLPARGRSVQSCRRAGNPP